jgi:hypothetical protein
MAVNLKEAAKPTAPLKPTISTGIYSLPKSNCIVQAEAEESGSHLKMEAEVDAKRSVGAAMDAKPTGSFQDRLKNWGRGTHQSKLSKPSSRPGTTGRIPQRATSLPVSSGSTKAMAAAAADNRMRRQSIVPKRVEPDVNDSDANASMENENPPTKQAADEKASSIKDRLMHWDKVASSRGAENVTPIRARRFSIQPRLPPASSPTLEERLKTYSSKIIEREREIAASSDETAAATTLTLEENLQNMRRRPSPGLPAAQKFTPEEEGDEKSDGDKEVATTPAQHQRKQLRQPGVLRKPGDCRYSQPR